MRILLGLLFITASSHAQMTEELFKETMGTTTAAAHCRLSTELKSSHPDAGPEPLAIEASVRGATDVLLYGGKSTDQRENAGIKAYMRDSVLADDRFFNAALRFYRQLKKQDDKNPAPNCGIETHAAFEDILENASVAAERDPYLTLKLLALFGHDNMKNEMDPGEPVDCRIAALNYVAPSAAASNIYCNGALKGLDYSAQDVNDGQVVAEACKKHATEFAELGVCNDRLDSYQADYYHVIVAAFLGCRRSILERQTLTPALAAKIADHTFVHLIDLYKTDSLAHALDKYHSDAEDTPRARKIEALLRFAFKRIRNRETPALPSYEKYHGLWMYYHTSAPLLYDSAPYAAALAIVRRWEFEFKFRSHQHRMGLEFGKRYCEKLQRLRVPVGAGP